MKSKIVKFQKELRVKFKNKSLLIEALTHKSANQKFNNEKLEFLGDRVLGLVLSKKLLDLYPNESEGILDKKFASLVNRKTCCKIAWSIRVQDYLLIGNTKKKITINDEKILSDCCEAIVGAVYIDQGFGFAKSFVLKIWNKQLESSDVTVLDPKTKLQEYSLKFFKKLPNYKIIGSTGPKHNPLYKVSVSIIGTKKFIGFGNSKQQAEQDSAAKLLKGKNI
jgi:ribonuclease III